MTPLSAQCHCGASIGVPCRPDGGTCRHRGAVLVARPCVVCDGDRHAVDGAQHECVRCGARSWPAVEVPETPAQAEARARLSNPVISIWHAAVDAYLKAKDAKESKR